MDFLRRLFGSPERDGMPDGSGADGAEPAAQDAADAEREPVIEALATGVACPYCAILIDPPPVRNRRCPSCRQPIVVRRVDGRLALLTEAAVSVFDAERQHDLDVLAWTAARERWLRLAESLRASPARGARLAAAPVSQSVVTASRTLYLSTLERAVQAARGDGRWTDVGGLRRQQARALYEEAGSPVPPPEEIAELHREGMLAVLRSFPPTAKHVELVSVGCCPACRADDGKAFPRPAEIRVPRLPHPGCTKGLCACDWWPAVVVTRKRRRRRVPAAAPVAVAAPLAALPSTGSGDELANEPAQELVDPDRVLPGPEVPEAS